MGLAYPAELEAVGGPNSSLPVLTKSSSGNWSQTQHMCQRMRDKRHMLKQRFRLDTGKILCPKRTISYMETGSPERFYGLCS